MAMFDDTARTFMEKPLIARLATIGADGFPHNVPIWYALDGDEIVFISDRTARKVINLQANPRCAVCIGGDPEDGAGYMIRGEARISDDAKQAMTHRLIYRYETKEAGGRLAEEWANDDIVVLRVKPSSIVKVY